ncbi:MAG: hypothetical protein M1829_002677 [Trizodia sp. TS-e1964]|nr:MAG: hypothetical protein M1829_002677 [Trizodia sp. TS-e1964]
MPPSANFNSPSSVLAAFKRKAAPSSADLHINTNNDSDERLDIFSTSGNMADTASSSPYIKDEPEDYAFQSSHHHRFMGSQSTEFGLAHPNNFPQYSHSPGVEAGIDPSDLMSPVSHLNGNGSFPHSYATNFPSQQSNGYNVGNANIPDDELIDLQLEDSQPGSNGFHPAQPGYPGHDHDYNSLQYSSLDHGLVSPTHPSQISHSYSNASDGQAIMSPAAHSTFLYDRFVHPPMHPYSQSTQSHSTYTASIGGGGGVPLPFSESPNGSYIPPAGAKSKAHAGIGRQASHSKSPMTSKTPALANLNLGTPESGSFPTQPIHTNHLGHHRHQAASMSSNHWGSNPGSVQSFIESPISSPGMPSAHNQISDILKSGKHASLPAKVGLHPVAGQVPGFQTQEAKRRRRRESHNQVERRRRDNINERIQELSHLVPHHRLEDEKIRKHLVNNSPLSPTLGGSGMSPPQATSLLAGGVGRRATGNITTGIPNEERDKGPNKGDILNGSVGWTRDMMWGLYSKYQQEDQCIELVTSLGGTWPFERTEEEKRLRTELFDAVEKNGPKTFSYSRGPGSGLRVPKHTTISGEPLHHSPLQSVSPTDNSTTGANSAADPGQFWSGHHSGGSGHGSIIFKEEDEYGMDMT